MTTFFASSRGGFGWKGREKKRLVWKGYKKASERKRAGRQKRETRGIKPGLSYYNYSYYSYYK